MWPWVQYFIDKLDDAQFDDMFHEFSCLNHVAESACNNTHVLQSQLRDLNVCWDSEHVHEAQREFVLWAKFFVKEQVAWLGYLEKGIEDHSNCFDPKLVVLVIMVGLNRVDEARKCDKENADSRY